MVYGKDTLSFLKMLDLVLDRMAKFNVRLKPSKCSFGMTSVEFLGHIFDEHGVHLSEKRVQGIKDLPIPTSVSAVRSFVGMVNNFRDFIPTLSSYLYPLTELIKEEKFRRKRLRSDGGSPKRVWEGKKYDHGTHHQSAHERL